MGAIMPYVCEDCNETVTIGDWPYCPHGKAQPSKGFEPFFSVSAGKMITGRGDIATICRPKWENDHIVQLREK